MKKTGNIIIIKTCNNPFLLKRCLNSLYKSCKKSRYQNFVIGIYDDSNKKQFIIHNKKIRKKFSDDNKVVIEYSNKKVTSKWIKQFSEELDISKKSLAVIFSDKGDLKNIGGFNAAHNAANIFGVLMTNKYGFDIENSIITIHEDDILYKILEYDTCSNKYKLFDHDYLYQRMLAFDNNSSIMISGGKCCGHSGSPISVVRQLLQFIAITIELGSSIVPADARSPFALYNEPGSFKSLTNIELYNYLDKIILSFLNRVPQIGFKTANYYEDLTSSTIIPSQGHLSCRISFLPKYLTPTFLVSEFYLIGLWRMIFGQGDKQGFFVEKPVTHLRRFRESDGDAFEKKLIDTILRDEYIVNQINLLNIFEESEETRNKVSYINDILDFDIYNFPNFRSYKLRDIAKIKHYVHILQCYIKDENLVRDYREMQKVRPCLEKLLVDLQKRIVPALEKKVLRRCSKVKMNLISSQYNDYLDSHEDWHRILIAASKKSFLQRIGK